MKKLISSMLVVTMLTGSGILSYADTVDNSIDSTVFEENEVLEENSLFSNRYVYTTEQDYLTTRYFTISEKQAETNGKYASFLRELMKKALGYVFNPGDSWIVDEIMGEVIDTMYTSPYEAAGEYEVEMYSVTQYKKDLLKGTKSVVRTGNRVIIHHAGKSVSKTIWK
ncbi:hypothetical protein [Filifactor alocis]|uniref:hypothetical protein n=1 Tax=Filifactor alocis TaxID=143361 RepID=UPI0028D7E404|nr:hypothetical protein [Filifactor alocis]